jgi:hypothetical protein
MKVKLQKFTAPSGESLDTVQLRIEESEMEENGTRLLEMRRYDMVTITLENQQSSIPGFQDLIPAGLESLSIKKEGGKETVIAQKPVFERIIFQAISTSISLCVTETGIIATVTFAVENKKVIPEIVVKNLRDQFVTLEFESGESPYSK